MNTHDLEAVRSFFAQVDEDGVSNAQKARELSHVIRRVDSTPKSKSYEDADTAQPKGAASTGAAAGQEGQAGQAGAPDADEVPFGTVEVDGKLVGFGIHIFNEDVYPLQSFEIYLRGCDLVGKLDLSGCADVVFVDVYRNRISDVDVSDMPSLRILGLQGNRIGALNLTGLPACQGIDVGFNQLTCIDVTRNPELVELYVNDNALTALDTSKNPALKYLRCQNNRLQELDVTANPLLRHLYATGNPLKRIKALAPGGKAALPLELEADGGGSVGLSFNPIYNAQWKETGEWEQSYHAYPDDGCTFIGWFDRAGACVSHDQDWQDDYGSSRQLVAKFE